MKKIIASLIFMVIFSFNIANTEAKELVRNCKYYYYYSLQGVEIELLVDVYDNEKESSYLTAAYYDKSFWTGKNTSKFYQGSPSISNWSEVKQISLNACPNYALVHYKGSKKVWLANNEEDLKNIANEKKYDSSEYTIIANNDYEYSQEDSKPYYDEVVEATNHIKDVYENYKLENCIDNNKIATRISKCNDIYEGLITFMNSEEDNVNGYLQANLIQSDDNRTIEFFDVLKQARKKWSDVKEELDEEDKKIKKELGLKVEEDSNKKTESESKSESESNSASEQAGGCFYCGGTYFPIGLGTLIRNIYNLIKILVPVIIIITGMIDLFKSVMASDEKKMDESKVTLIKKLIAGVFIFLIFAIVQFVFTNFLIRKGVYSKSKLACISYFIATEPDKVDCPTRDNNYEIPIDPADITAGSSNYCEKVYCSSLDSSGTNSAFIKCVDNCKISQDDCKNNRCKGISNYDTNSYNSCMKTCISSPSTSSSSNSTSSSNSSSNSGIDASSTN